MIETALTLAAILALTGLNWWLGRSGRLARARGDAVARFQADLIDFVEREGEDTDDGAARVAVGAKETDLAVAVAKGDGWVTRRFGCGSLRTVTRDGARLRIRTRDLTLPVVTLSFAEADRASRWEGRFATLMVGGTGQAALAAAPPGDEQRATT